MFELDEETKDMEKELVQALKKKGCPDEVIQAMLDDANKKIDEVVRYNLTKNK